MISTTAEYALRVMTILNQHPGEGLVRAGQIAAESGVPLPYVATIMHRLRHEGLVTGKRGRGGGFQLSGARGAMTVRDVISVFDDVEAKKTCVMGHPICGVTRDCPVHSEWAHALDAYERFLDTMTLDRLAGIQDVAQARGRGRSKRTIGRKPRQRS
jgi:Rrf2 family protein